MSARGSLIAKARAHAHREAGASWTRSLTTKAGNGQDIINYANGINGQFGFLMGQVEGNPVLTRAARERLAELDQQWAAVRGEIDTIEQVDVPAFNKLLQDGNVPGVSVRKVVKVAPPIS